MAKKKVVIEVLRGVAEVTECPDDVDVVIIDHDNEKREAEAQSFAHSPSPFRIVVGK